MEVKLPVSKTISTGILGWLAVGAVSILYTTLTFQPPTATLGVAGSPARIAYWYQYVVLIEVPLAALFMYWFSRDQSHRAPPGRYMPNKSYSIFNSYNLAAIAILAALYAALGAVTGITNVDIVAMATAFAASFFGPVVAFFSVFVGTFIRFAIGGLSNIVTNPVAVPAFGLSDASRWAINGFIIWQIVRSQKETVSSAALWFAVLPLIILVHGGSIIMSFFAQNPWGPFVGNVGFMGFWYPTSLISIIVGLAVAEGAYRAATRNVRRLA